MSIKYKTLKKLHDNIGTSPDLIFSYQKLYAGLIGKECTDKELEDAFNSVSDKKISFSKLKYIINFEKQNTNDFTDISNSIIDIIDNNKVVGIRTYNRLKKELLDSYKAIEISYISIDDYDPYSKIKDSIIEKMEAHEPVLLTEIKFKKRI